MKFKERRVTQRANIQNKDKVQKLYQKIDNIRTDYINKKTIAEIVKTKPSYND